MHRGEYVAVSKYRRLFPSGCNAFLQGAVHTEQTSEADMQARQ